MYNLKKINKAKGFKGFKGFKRLIKQENLQQDKSEKREESHTLTVSGTKKIF